MKWRSGHREAKPRGPFTNRCDFAPRAAIRPFSFAQEMKSLLEDLSSQKGELGAQLREKRAQLSLVAQDLRKEEEKLQEVLGLVTKHKTGWVSKPNFEQASALMISPRVHLGRQAAKLQGEVPAVKPTTQEQVRERRPQIDFEKRKLPDFFFNLSRQGFQSRPPIGLLQTHSPVASSRFVELKHVLEMSQLEQGALEGLQLQHSHKMNELEKMRVAILEVRESRRRLGRAVPCCALQDLRLRQFGPVTLCFLLPFLKSVFVS